MPRTSGSTRAVGGITSPRAEPEAEDRRGARKGLSGLIKSRKIASFEGVGSLGPERTVTVTTADGGRTEPRVAA